MSKLSIELPKEFEVIKEKARLKQFPKDQIIIYANDVIHEAFILSDGYVKIYDIDDDGNEKILHIVKPPAVMPFVFFSGRELHTRWFYSALTDCEIYVMENQDLWKLMENNSKLNATIVNDFSQDVHELLTRLSSLGKTTVTDKIIATLKFFVIWHAVKQKSGWYRVPFLVNHQLIADINGVTRESASVAMKDLSEKKIVRHPKLTVLEINKERLMKL